MRSCNCYFLLAWSHHPGITGARQTWSLDLCLTGRSPPRKSDVSMCRWQFTAYSFWSANAAKIWQMVVLPHLQPSNLIEKDELKKKRSKPIQFILSLKSYEAKAQHAKFFLLLPLKETHASETIFGTTVADFHKRPLIKFKLRAALMDFCMFKVKFISACPYRFSQPA